jgi:hypothetical protein
MEAGRRGVPDRGGQHQCSHLWSVQRGPPVGPHPVSIDRRVCRQPEAGRALRHPKRCFPCLLLITCSAPRLLPPSLARTPPLLVISHLQTPHNHHKMAAATIACSAARPVVAQAAFTGARQQPAVFRCGPGQCGDRQGRCWAQQAARVAPAPPPHLLHNAPVPAPAASPACPAPPWRGPPRCSSAAPPWRPAP